MKELLLIGLMIISFKGYSQELGSRDLLFESELDLQRNMQLHQRILSSPAVKIKILNLVMKTNVNPKVDFSFQGILPSQSGGLDNKARLEVVVGDGLRLGADKLSEKLCLTVTLSYDTDSIETGEFVNCEKRLKF